MVKSTAKKSSTPQLHDHGKDFFGYDLLEASNRGKISERIFHKDRVRMWMRATKYQGKKVLDVGCNTGILLIPLAKKKVDVIGIDNNPSDIKKTKENLLLEGLSTKIAIIADARKLPFPNNTFDVVLLSDILEHSSDPKKVAKESLRVVKKGGIILATVPYFLHPVVKYPRIRKILSGRKNIDEYPDIPFTFKKLKSHFPGTTVKEKKLVYFWSSILGIFEK